MIIVYYYSLLYPSLSLFSIVMYLKDTINKIFFSPHLLLTKIKLNQIRFSLQQTEIRKKKERKRERKKKKKRSRGYVYRVFEVYRIADLWVL